jgi:hypothetical protein
MHPVSTGIAAMGAAHITAVSSIPAGTAAAAAALPIVGWILIAIGLATLLGGLAYAVYKTVKGTYHTLINSTDAVLDLANKEVLKWQTTRPNKKDKSTEAVSKEKILELLGKYENLTQS